MKKIILVFLGILQVNAAFASNVSKTRSVASSLYSTQGEGVVQIRTWPGIRAELMKITEKFKSQNLTEDQKVSLFPATNELLSSMQVVTVSQSEKLDQIDVVVKLLAASLEYDFASSNEDTVYFEYIKHKALYQKAITSLSDKDTGKELLETFADLENSTAE